MIMKSRRSPNQHFRENVFKLLDACLRLEEVELLKLESKVKTFDIKKMLTLVRRLRCSKSVNR